MMKERQQSKGTVYPTTTKACSAYLQETPLSTGGPQEQTSEETNPSYTERPGYNGGENLQSFDGCHNDPSEAWHMDRDTPRVSKTSSSYLQKPPIPLNKEQLKMMRALLVLVPLLATGFLLLLHLYIVDSLHSNQNSLQLQERSASQKILGKDTQLIMNNPITFTVEDGGVPEAEIVQPVGLEDKPLDDSEMGTVTIKPNKTWCAFQDIKQALKETAEENVVFIQIIPDINHIILARNNLETLIRRTGRKNLLFICQNVEQCAIMPRHDIGCYIHESIPGSAVPAFFVISSALELKYQVAYIDFDVSITNQVPMVKGGDLVIPYGNSPRASNFYISHGTPLATDMHKIGLKAASANPHRIFLSVFKAMLDRSLKKSLKIKTLENCTKTLDTRCSILRHPFFKAPADRMLWIKEKQLWFYDNERYYTATDRLYLTYENNIDMGKDNWQYQIHALKNALAYGQILKRTIILPKFLCWKCVNSKCQSQNCLLSSIVNMTAFDSVFGKSYREHSFKGHRMLPLSIKKNVSEVVAVASPLVKKMLSSGGKLLDVKLRPRRTIQTGDSTDGPDSGEVQDLCERYRRTSILRLLNLYGAFSGFTDARESVEFEQKLKVAL